MFVTGVKTCALPIYAWRAEQVRQALNANPEAHYSLDELSIADAWGDLPDDMRERLKRGERGVVPE